MLEKLRVRWNLKTTWDVWVVLFIFSITGSSTVFIRKPIFAYLDITSETAVWIKVALWIAIIFPSYQMLLLFYGFIFRQWTFVWTFEKKVLSRFGIHIK